MLAACIRKQNQVNGDTVLVQPNEKGGAVRTASIGNNIDMLTSFQSLFISVFHLRRIQRFGRAAPAGPLPSARQPRALPAGGTKADAALRVQNVGDDPMVAQDLRRPRRRAIEEAASVFFPSVQRRLTSRVSPSSRYRLTGRPTMATPARWPFAMQPRENLCPRTGLWWRWCSATNLFASARDIGFTVSIGSASISCTAVCRRHKGGTASNSS